MNRRHLPRAAGAASMAWSWPRANAQGARVAVKLALNRAPYDASNAPFLLAQETGILPRKAWTSRCPFEERDGRDPARVDERVRLRLRGWLGEHASRNAEQGTFPRLPLHDLRSLARLHRHLEDEWHPQARRPRRESHHRDAGRWSIQMFQPFLGGGVARDAVRIVESGLEDRRPGCSAARATARWASTPPSSTS